VCRPWGGAFGSEARHRAVTDPGVDTTCSHLLPADTADARQQHRAGTSADCWWVGPAARFVPAVTHRLCGAVSMGKIGDGLCLPGRNPPTVPGVILPPGRPFDQSSPRHPGCSSSSMAIRWIVRAIRRMARVWRCFPLGCVFDVSLCRPPPDKLEDIHILYGFCDTWQWVHGPRKASVPRWSARD